jgi:Uma2 family endonuclease
MSVAGQAIEVTYPESDGKPMGETDVHRAWMIRIYDLLAHRYRGQRVYIGSDLLLYFVEGQPARYLVPDDFVVLDSDPGHRRTFLTWKEGRVPNVVFEVTSQWTRREDEVFKPKTYAEIGVRELFLYDPTADYLKPPLRGYRLDDDQQYVVIEPNAQGQIESLELGVVLQLNGRDLLMTDAHTRQRLLTEAESEREARQHEREARLAAEQRAAAAEAELARLRDEIARRQNEHEGGVPPVV